jgi:hypothetical protein
MYKYEFTGLPSVRQHTIPTTQTAKKNGTVVNSPTFGKIGYFPDAFIRWQRGQKKVLR